MLQVNRSSHTPWQGQVRWKSARASILKEYRKHNARVNLVGKHALVVGGTQGIGEATALQLASLGASVTITGRNKDRANRVLHEMQQSSRPSDNAQYKFEQLEVTKMDDVKQFAKGFAEEHRETGLQTLVLCAGGLNFGPRRETPEGIEKTFAMNVLSRFLLTYYLQPALSKNKEGRVINVLGAGNGGPINLYDLELKKGFSFIRAAAFHSTITDLLTKEFAQRNPSTTYHHIFPGIVATNGLANNNFPSPLVFLASLVTPYIAIPPSDVAEVLTYIATAEEYGLKKSGGLWGPSGKKVPVSRYLEQEVNGPVVWRYCLERGGVVE
ncbi:hypothetical protein HDV00_006402 [Rhizophlyctis rosea]|nr:hypothetical protein HDV00_006402 [Rhizophlyctis rosea]